METASTDPRRKTGRLGEDFAAEHLLASGYSVIARNVRTRRGELDVICLDDRELVIVEVKCARERDRSYAAINPLDSIGHHKRQRLRRLTAALLAGDPAGILPLGRFSTVRFDAIGVILGANGELVRLEHVKHAF